MGDRQGLVGLLCDRLTLALGRAEAEVDDFYTEFNQRITRAIDESASKLDDKPADGVLGMPERRNAAQHARFSQPSLSPVSPRRAVFLGHASEIPAKPEMSLLSNVAGGIGRYASRLRRESELQFCDRPERTHLDF